MDPRPARRPPPDPGRAGLPPGLQRRDPDAAAELYDRHGRLVYSLVYRMVRNQAVAEEIVQEAFLHIWHRAQFFDPEKGSFSTRIVADGRGQLEAQQIRSARIQQALAVLSAPGTRLATAGQTEVQPRATYFLNPRRGVVLIGAHLTGLDPAHLYQMWIIPKGQAPKPAGLFRPDDAGNAVHLFETQVAPGSTAALALSVEPQSGSPAPTTTPILVAPVTGDETEPSGKPRPLTVPDGSGSRRATTQQAADGHIF